MRAAATGEASLCSRPPPSEASSGIGVRETDMATVVSKRYDAAAAKIRPGKQYSLEEAVAIIKSMPPTKFDQSVDLSFRLGVDPKHADQMVRGAVVLPHGIGKSVRVAVFAKGDKEREAREAAGDDDGAGRADRRAGDREPVQESGLGRRIRRCQRRRRSTRSRSSGRGSTG